MTKTSATQAEQLAAMGFLKCGEWTIENDKLKYIFPHDSKAPNVLYAFVSLGKVLYVGKTVRSLKRRMYGHQNPGATQSTNIKGNKLIREMLAQGSAVEIHSLPDNGLLYYGGFHVNLAAGLEDSMIIKLKPKWNKGRDTTSKTKLVSD